MGGGVRCLRRPRYRILDRAPRTLGSCFAPAEGLVSLQASFGDRRGAFDRRDRDRRAIYREKGAAAPSQANVFVLCVGGDFVGDWNLDARVTLNVRKHGSGVPSENSIHFRSLFFHGGLERIPQKPASIRMYRD